MKRYPRELRFYLVAAILSVLIIVLTSLRTSFADFDAAEEESARREGSLTRVVDGKQPNLWRPDDQWIKQCVQDLESTDLQPFKVVWRRYVLGDCIKQCRNCYTRKCVWHPEKVKEKGSGCYQKATRNDTFAAMYHFRACRANKHIRDGNLTIVDEILRQAEAKDPTLVRPPQDTLVLHLRLGDVIENSKSSVVDMLAKGGDPWHTDTYKNAIKSISEYLADIEQSGLRDIVIRGGSHDPNYFRKSRVYAGCLFRAILQAGYTSATMNLEGNTPDHDFYYIGYAKFLSVSSGGFSRLMGTMAKRHGAEMVGREFLPKSRA